MWRNFRVFKTPPLVTAWLLKIIYYYTFRNKLTDPLPPLRSYVTFELAITDALTYNALYYAHMYMGQSIVNKRHYNAGSLINIQPLHLNSNNVTWLHQKKIPHIFVEHFNGINLFELGGWTFFALFSCRQCGARNLIKIVY